MTPYTLSIGMLCISSSLMIVAWYGHLKFTNQPLWIVILVSWGIAFFEYLFQVPANRIDHSVMSAAQLRIIAEVLTLVAFFLFSTFVLKESFSLNYLISFICILIAVYFAFYGPFKN
ncbi:DMT family protein [Pigmentibacter sp. JX0631]|uniref:DMT family protein n=1 Tax=Pigmentibacter sp. JX0631 TaxID=2976982 RepID=UPI0024697058|nr:DMT family protein [Pigmentibacter sp. JX0631]WGL59939.1 DMT family protein [Pigmentibacter sp. JX0631]